MSRNKNVTVIFFGFWIKNEEFIIPILFITNFSKNRIE